MRCGMGAFGRLVLLIGSLQACQAQLVIFTSSQTTTTTTSYTATVVLPTVTTQPGDTSTTTTTWTSTSTTTTALCALEEWQGLTFDVGSRGKCVDVNGTEIRNVWRGNMTDAECFCECQSEPRCYAYAYWPTNKACAMYGDQMTTVLGTLWTEGVRLWRRPENTSVPWVEGALWQREDSGNDGMRDWFVALANSTLMPFGGMFALPRFAGDYVAPVTDDDWNCHIKINITIAPPIPNNVTFTCPLGDASTTLTCQSQMILVIFFAFVAPIICCCSFCCVLLQFMKKWDCICECVSSICCGCRRPKRGKESCGDFGKKHGKLGWHVEKVREEKGMRKNTPGMLENIAEEGGFSPFMLPGPKSAAPDEEAPEQEEFEDEIEEPEEPVKKSRWGRSSKPKKPKEKEKPKEAKPKKKGKVKTHIRTHVIWDLDTLRVAEAIGAKATKKAKDLVALEDDPNAMLGEIPHLPSYLEGRSIPATSVDLGGVWGNFMLSAKIVTTERDGVIVGKVMPKGQEGTGAPKVLLLHDAKLRWVCPDEDGNLCALDGRTDLADGKEHTVGICYDRSADKHVLIVDGEPDGCTGDLPLSVDCDDAKLILGSQEWPSNWNFSTPNGRFHFFGQIWDVKWNGGYVHPEVGEDLTMPPTMYLDNEDVEYFSRTHGMWMLGNIGINPPQDVEEGGVKEVSYGLLMPSSKQTRHNVSLDSIRLTMKPGEACEVFSQAKGGNRWKQGEVVEAKTSRALPSYKIRPTRGPDTAATMVTSTVTRRRYIAGSRVFVYREPKEGWTGCWTVAKVLAPNLADVQRGTATRGWAPGETPDAEGRLKSGRRVTGPMASDATLLPGPSVNGAQPTMDSVDSSAFGNAVFGPNMTAGSVDESDLEMGNAINGPNMSSASSGGMGAAVGGPTWSNISRGSGLGLGGQVGGAMQSNASGVSNASSGSKLSRRLRAPKEKDGDVLGYWTMIPVQEEGSDQMRREMVPSFLIRIAPQAKSEDNPIVV